MPRVRRRKSRSATVSMTGVPTIPAELHQQFRLDREPSEELAELGLDYIGVATAEIRRRQLAKHSGQPNIELPEEMGRWA